MLEIAEEKLRVINLPEKQNFKNYIKRIPMGVSLVIAPWNYPYLTSVNSIIPALAAGNTIILKHSAQTPLCAEQLFLSAKNTLPKNVFNYLHLNHEDSLKVVADKRIAFVSFTGSVKAGYEIQRATTKKFISVALELGGKDPMIICDDADIEIAAQGASWGGFVNAGQVCTSIERVYVFESVADQFTEAIIEEAKKVDLGDPFSHNTDIGPMASKLQQEKAIQ